MHTFVLASIFGPVLLAAGLGMLGNEKHYQNVMKDFEKQAGLAYVSGAALLALGVLIVNAHTVWELTAAGLVTLLAWGMVVKGVLLIVAPGQVMALAKQCEHFIKLAAVVALVVGGYLSYVAYFAAPVVAEIIEVLPAA